MRRMLRRMGRCAALGLALCAAQAGAEEVMITKYEVLHDTAADQCTVNWIAATSVDPGVRSLYVLNTDDDVEYERALFGVQIHSGTYTEPATYQHSITAQIVGMIDVIAEDEHTLAEPSTNTCTIISGSGLEHVDETTDRLSFRLRWFNKDGGNCTAVIEREVDSAWEEFGNLGLILNNSTVFTTFHKDVAHSLDHKYRCVLECAADHVGTEVTYPHPVIGP